MIVIVGRPLRLVGRPAIEIYAACSPRDRVPADAHGGEGAAARDRHAHAHHQCPRDERHHRRENRAVIVHVHSPRAGECVRTAWCSTRQSNSLAKRRFSRFFHAPRWYASLASSGRTEVASANTICSIAVDTLPQLAASWRVEEEQAPSRTSATVIWTAYLCTSTSSWPRISAHTTVSWAKFLGTPPPIISSPVVPALTLMSVSSRKSAMLSSVMYGLSAFIASTWCLTRPNPAELSTNAGQKIGTSCS